MKSKNSPTSIKIEGDPIPGTLDALLTIDDLADYLKRSTHSIRRDVSNKRLPFIRVGGSIRFDRSQVREYLVERSVKVRA